MKHLFEKKRTRYIISRQTKTIVIQKSCSYSCHNSMSELVGCWISRNCGENFGRSGVWDEVSRYLRIALALSVVGGSGGLLLTSMLYIARQRGEIL
jgi:hypothetical protein